MNLAGRYGENHSFGISEFVLHPPSGDGENPVVTFALRVRENVSEVMEEVLDGALPRHDGCWIDRIEFRFDPDEQAELLDAVNETIKPLVVHTALDFTAVRIMADELGLTLSFQNQAPIDTWLVRDEFEIIGEFSSLHQASAELNRLSKLLEHR